MENAQYTERFSDADLVKIIDEGMIYMCACPAQLAEALRKVRQLYRYQNSCLLEPRNDSNVHKAIAESAAMAHQQLEDCMEKILEIEKWDRATLSMPAGLRRRQAEEIAGESGFQDLSSALDKQVKSQ
jgi:hypothetical protein